MKYKRILLKLSGEALMGNKNHGIDPERLNEYATEIKETQKKGTEIAIVIGGGNIFRGVSGASKGMDRVQADYMGMLATVINGLALQSALENNDVSTRLQTAIKIEAIALGVIVISRHPLTPTVQNHEMIHYHQYRELGFLFFLPIYLWDFVPF